MYDYRVIYNMVWGWSVTFCWLVGERGGGREDEACRGAQTPRWHRQGPSRGDRFPASGAGSYASTHLPVLRQVRVTLSLSVCLWLCCGLFSDYIVSLWSCIVLLLLRTMVRSLWYPSIILHVVVLSSFLHYSGRGVHCHSDSYFYDCHMPVCICLNVVSSRVYCVDRQHSSCHVSYRHLPPLPIDCLDCICIVAYGRVLCDVERRRTAWMDRVSEDLPVARGTKKKQQKKKSLVHVRKPPTK